MSAANIPEDKIRSAEQIENDLKRTREDLAATVNELAGRLDPKNLAKEAGDQAKVKINAFTNTAKEKATSFSEKAKRTVDDAKNGDARALAILGGGAAAVIAGIALVLRGRK
ncbi:DUF3618 domain-containing protein [Actinomycetaceae bacterium L2_0104]